MAVLSYSQEFIFSSCTAHLASAFVTSAGTVYLVPCQSETRHRAEWPDRLNYGTGIGIPSTGTYRFGCTDTDYLVQVCTDLVA
eukprot:SAG11_NODE_600_length_8259_cov_6.574510_8_plen_83_part_00